MPPPVQNSVTWLHLIATEEKKMCVPWRQMTIIRWTGGQSLQLLHSSLWVTKYMSAFVLYRKITQSSTGSLHVLQVQWHLSSDLRSKKTRYLLHLFPTQLWMGNRNRWNGRDMAIISPHKLQNPTQRIRKVPWSERASGLLAKLPCLFSVDAGSTFWEMIPFFFFLIILHCHLWNGHWGLLFP